MSYYPPMTLAQAADIVDLSIQAVYGPYANPYAFREMDEYERYNRSRENRYIDEDIRYKQRMLMLAGATTALALIGCILCI